MNGHQLEVERKFSHEFSKRHNEMVEFYLLYCGSAHAKIKNVTPIDPKNANVISLKLYKQ